MDNLKSRISFYTNRPEEKQRLLNEYNTSKISEALYLKDNGYSSAYMVCSHGNQKKFKQYTTGYGYCKNNCFCMKEDIKKNNLKKYGVEYVSQAQSVKQKKKEKFKNKSEEELQQIRNKNSRSLKKAYAENKDKILSRRKETNQLKYGTDHVFQNKEIREKYKQTSIKRYGVSSPTQTTEWKEKYKDVFQEKYGVDNPNKLVSVKEKKIQTNVEKYGHPYLIQNEKYKKQIHEKAKETFLQKYGVDHPWKSKEVRKCYEQTMVSKYGVNHPSLRHLNDTYINLDVLDLKSKVEQGYSISEIQEYLGCSKSKAYLILNRYGLLPEFSNVVENSLSKFLENCGEEFFQNIRKIISPLELDFYIPAKNLAIEINGIYWHSENKGKTREYHLNKTLRCSNLGIHLLHFWDYEYIEKPIICNSIISNHLGLNVSIPGRKTIVREITGDEIRSFVDENHIQGYQSSKINLGLFYQSRLVSVMSLSKPRYNKNYEWEIVRFCNKAGLNVIGGAGKLLSYFKKRFLPRSLITYSERRLFTGNIYKNLGFEFKGYSKPNYFYTRDYINLESRLKYQKHKLNKILESFDPKMTEWENMKMNGYDRIWDCGNSIWVWQR